jgi:NAD(P)-dependent dehydrogenase (short-subunit alcohol dehydrogenase family)
VDILVNVAGLLTTTATVDYTEELWDLHTDVNYKAVFFCSQAAARIMIPKGRGKIVNIASTSAFISSREPKVAYDSCKGAVRQLTVSMGAELARKGINVNAVAPGTTRTEMTSFISATPEQQAAILQRIPLGRIGEPKDVVGPVLFLCSPAADYVVGHTLVVDGGWLL